MKPVVYIASPYTKGDSAINTIENLYDWVNHGCKDERKVSR